MEKNCYVMIGYIVGNKGLHQLYKVILYRHYIPLIPGLRSSKVSQGKYKQCIELSRKWCDECSSTGIALKHKL